MAEIGFVKGLALAAALASAGCAARGEFEFAEPDHRAGSQVEIFVATQRQAADGTALDFNGDRATDLSFLRYQVSVPAGHKTGQIEWPKGKLDPEKHFYVTDAARFADLKSFTRTVTGYNNANGQRREVMVFVHGYNTNLAEGTFRLAQITHDYKSSAPHILYSWPSAANPRGYIYDRDSTVFARDGLEKLLDALADAPVDRVLLVGHSMGTYLVTETLRQMSIRGNARIFSKLSGVFLVSPDIDIEIFKSQVERIRPLPKPFVLFVSQKDRALRLSARLTGKEARLGNLSTIDDLVGLNVTVVDVTELGDGRELDHSIPASSPAAIAIVDTYLRNRDDPQHPSQVDGSFWRDQIEAVGDTIRIVLTPGVAAAAKQ